MDKLKILSKFNNSEYLEEAMGVDVSDEEYCDVMTEALDQDQIDKGIKVIIAEAKSINEMLFYALHYGASLNESKDI